MVREVGVCGRPFSRNDGAEDKPLAYARKDQDCCVGIRAPPKLIERLGLVCGRHFEDADFAVRPEVSAGRYFRGRRLARRGKSPLSFGEQEHLYHIRSIPE